MVERLSIRLQRPVRNGVYKLDYVGHRLLRGFRDTPPIDPRTVKRILLVELTFIGDLLVATPTIEQIKKRFPKAKIDVLMYKKFASILEGNPHIDDLLLVDKEPSITRWKEFSSLLENIKKRNYDMGVVLHHGTFSNGLLFLLSHMKYRVGCVRAGMTLGKGFFLTHKAPPYPGDQHDEHVVLQNLHVLSAFGDHRINVNQVRLHMHVPKEDKQWASNFLKKNKLSKRKPIIAIHPGTRHPSHEWFIDRFAQVADWLVETHKAQIVFTGDGYDKEHFVDHIRKKMQYKSVYAKTTLKQCAALLSQCNLLLSVDTSMVHIGAAAGVPVLGLYGSGKPKAWAPWGSQHRVIFHEEAPCTGCRKTTCSRPDYICMRSITVREVQEALEGMLKEC